MSDWHSKKIPDDIREVAKEIARRGSGVMLPFDAGDAAVEHRSRWQLANSIAAAIMAERERCAAICDDASVILKAANREEELPAFLAEQIRTGHKPIDWDSV